MTLVAAQPYLAALRGFSFEHLDVRESLCSNPPVVVAPPFGDTGCADFRAYDWDPDPFFRVQALSLAKIAEVVDKGERLLARLYATRGCYRSLPQVQSNDDPKRAELYSRTFQILKPEIEKAKDLMHFLTSSIATFKETIATLSGHYKDHWGSSELFAQLAKLFNLFVTLDYVKNMKGSLNNDLSFYKRALANMGSRTSASDEETAELHQLYLFLGNHDQFITLLRKEASQMAGHEDIILDMCTWCAESLETNVIIVPEERWGLLKALALGLLLLDTLGDEKDSYLVKRKVKLDKFGKILRATLVVPLFGDVPIRLGTVYMRGTYLAKRGWDLESEDPNRNQLLPQLIPAKRPLFSHFIADWVAARNTIGAEWSNPINLSERNASDLYHLLHRGLLLLSSLTSQVLECCAWKFVHPAKRGGEIPESALDYDLCHVTVNPIKALAYNFSPREKDSLLEYLDMIERLTTLMTSSVDVLSKAVQIHIGHEVQVFCKTVLQDIAALAAKKKKGSTVQVSSHHTFNRFSLMRQVWRQGDIVHCLQHRPPSLYGLFGNSLQLQAIQALLDHCTNERAASMRGGFLKEKDFKEEDAKAIQGFLRSAFGWLQLVDIRKVIMRSSDVSGLWYKEFWLELSREIQFPIESSLPWVLLTHTMDSNNPEHISRVAAPLKIYNDAGSRTLYDMGSRNLYDELVAEVNLLVDQFIFKLSEKLYSHCKVHASIAALSTDHHTLSEVVFEDVFPLSKYDELLSRLRALQLLGRSSNISAAIGQCCNNFLKKNVDLLIQRFEASDLSYLHDFKTLIAITYRTHTLLSRLLELDPWEDILPSGRILAHTVFELLNDLSTCWGWNGSLHCFSRTPLIDVPEVLARSQFPKCGQHHLYGNKTLQSLHESSNQCQKDTFGFQHFESLICVLGEWGTAVVIGEAERKLTELVKGSIAQYIKVIRKGVPEQIRLPLFEYGVSGSTQFFSAQLKPLLGYTELQSGIYNHFRQAGNLLIFATHLLRATEFTMPHSQKPSLAMQSFDLPQGASLRNVLLRLLEQFKSLLREQRNDWEGIRGEPGHLPFWKTWSALQFSLCYMSRKVQWGTREMFGEGLGFMGYVMVAVLGDRHPLEAFDFVSHCLRINEASMRSDDDNGYVSASEY
ncbi:cytoplasmic FMR1-interacting, partial [Gonapodya prolifera JEL478]